MGDSLTERLRRLEDAAQIRQLNLEYRRHLDGRDLDAYGRLFAEDGEWLGGTGYGQGTGRDHGDAEGAAGRQPRPARADVLAPGDRVRRRRPR
jgi:hypothetical protein